MDDEDKKAFVATALLELATPPSDGDPLDYGSVRDMVNAMVEHKATYPTAIFEWDDSRRALSRLRVAFRDRVTGRGWAIPMARLKLDCTGNNLIHTIVDRERLAKTLNQGDSPYVS